MYKQFLMIFIIYFSGLIANEAKIDTTKSLANEKAQFEKKVKSLLLDTSTFDELFEKAFQSKIYKLLNPESFSLIVELNPNKLDDITALEIVEDDDGTLIPATIYSNLTSEQIKIKVYIDESVYNDEIHKSVVQIIKSTQPGLKECDDCIEIESIKKIMDEKSTISLNRDDIYDDSWAVIIGIDKYKYSKQLNYAVKDAEAVKDMLINKFDFPEDNIRYLVNEEATLSEIKLALDDISTSADENDRILVFYSGHGETIQGIDGTEKGYIIPYEGKQKKAYATGLAMDEILTISMLSKSKHMLFLMDACYSGLMTQQFKGLSKPQEEGYLSKVANEKARQIITAGGRDEQVIERDEWQHSAFTKNLLEGLETWEADYNDDGCITADELSSYLRENVTEDSDFLQTPQDGRFRNSGGGEFVFFSDATITIPSTDVDEEDEIIYGCTDMDALNYNPYANLDDISCIYEKTITFLTLGTFDSSNNIIPIIINNNPNNIKEYTFDLTNVDIVRAYGGISENNAFNFITDTPTVKSYSENDEALLRGNNQILCFVEIVPNYNKPEICLENAHFTTNTGENLHFHSYSNFYLQNWVLDCLNISK